MRHVMLVTLIGALTTTCINSSNAQQSQEQYPVLDTVANKVVQKYESSSCEQLAAQRATPPTGQRAAIEDRAVQMLHQNAGMQQEFINRVAAPIANKLFACNLIP